MFRREQWANSGHHDKPERILPETLAIPDLSFLTSVIPPAVLDLGSPEFVASWLGEMVAEEKGRNNGYYGMFLFGSVAERRAVGGSDVDILHVVRPSIRQQPYQVAEAFRHRLMAVIKQCYRNEVDDTHYLDLARPATWENDAERLNQYSMPIGIPSVVVGQIQHKIHYQDRGAYSGERPYKKASADTVMPTFRYPTDGLFPWWAEYGLLEPIGE